MPCPQAVDVQRHRVIYHLVDGVKEALEAAIDPVFEDRTKTTSAAGLVKLPRLSNTMGLNGCVDAKETFEFYCPMDRVSEANCPEDRKEPEKG